MGCLTISFFLLFPVSTSITISFSDDASSGPDWMISTFSTLFAVSFSLQVFQPNIVNIIILLTYILITGGLHLDGLSDTFDGIFSGRDRDRMLEIMRDSRVGTYGVLSLGFWILSMFVVLNYLPREALIVFPIVGKSAPMLSAYVGDYVRKEGLGKIFASSIGKIELSFAFIIPIIASIILGFSGVLAVLVSLIAVYLMTKYFVKVIGGITGDTMGAVCELSQLCFLFILYFTQGAFS